jgi:hypothetical protein
MKISILIKECNDSEKVADALIELAERLRNHPHFSEGHSQQVFSDNKPIGWFDIWDNSERELFI